MLFKIIFYSAFVYLAGCSQLAEKSCMESKVELQAYKDGAAGLANRHHRLKKKCDGSAALKKRYDEAYKKGSLEFCSAKRGREQAGLGLRKERICLDAPKYNEGYLETLKTTCTKQKARNDAKKLLNSDNRLCLVIPNYKKMYLFHLQKSCSYKKGYSIGLSKRNIDKRCIDTQKAKSFQNGYAAGLSQSYKNDNLKAQKEIFKKNSIRKKLKNSLSKLKKPKEIQLKKIELNVLESQILELEHFIERNKRFIK